MNYQSQIDANYYFARYNEILFNMQRDMLVTETTSNITLDFIRCMIPHNITGIYISENLLKYTNSIVFKNVANNIIEIQKRKIEYMKEIYNNIMPYLNSEKEVNNYFKKYFKITNNILSNMQNSQRVVNINLSYVYEMIPYFEGEVKLYQNVIKFNVDPRIRNLASTIIMQNSNIISTLKQMDYNLKNNMI